MNNMNNRIICLMHPSVTRLEKIEGKESVV